MTKEQSVKQHKSTLRSAIDICAKTTCKGASQRNNTSLLTNLVVKETSEMAEYQTEQVSTYQRKDETMSNEHNAAAILFAKSIEALAEIESMKAENEWRKIVNQQVSYGEECFLSIRERLKKERLSLFPFSNRGENNT